MSTVRGLGVRIGCRVWVRRRRVGVCVVSDFSLRSDARVAATDTGRKLTSRRRLIRPSGDGGGARSERRRRSGVTQSERADERARAAKNAGAHTYIRTSGGWQKKGEGTPRLPAYYT